MLAYRGTLITPQRREHCRLRVEVRTPAVTHRGNKHEETFGMREHDRLVPTPVRFPALLHHAPGMIVPDKENSFGDGIEAAFRLDAIGQVIENPQVLDRVRVTPGKHMTEPVVFQNEVSAESPREREKVRVGQPAHVFRHIVAHTEVVVAPDSNDPLGRQDACNLRAGFIGANRLESVSQCDQLINMQSAEASHCQAQWARRIMNICQDSDPHAAP